MKHQSYRGLLKGSVIRPWKAAPANASDAPTQKARNTLGKRIFQIIISSFLGPLQPTDMKHFSKNNM